MMKIEWNKVTWYSKLIAVALFVATFAIAFCLGQKWEARYTGAGIELPDYSEGGGEACGGGMVGAPGCPAGYHCQPSKYTTGNGGHCVKDTATAGDSTTVTIGVGQSARIDGVEIRVIEILEDSRCAAEVQCIWAGQLRLKVAIGSDNRNYEFTNTGSSAELPSGTMVTLISVEPAQRHVADDAAYPSNYRFTFKATK